MRIFRSTGGEFRAIHIANKAEDNVVKQFGSDRIIKNIFTVDATSGSVIQASTSERPESRSIATEVLRSLAESPVLFSRRSQQF